uniref:Uncharacterized protein n=1 Tax=Anguilla anguilla TaxID=7936 RepID=A0A0E9X4K1_ANGAN
MDPLQYIFESLSGYVSFVVKCSFSSHFTEHCFAHLQIVLSYRKRISTVLHSMIFFFKL